MFKIGTVPSVEADPVEHADFLEIECLRQSDLNISGGDLAAALGRVADDFVDDKAKADVTLEATVEQAFFELSERSSHSGNGPHSYPFVIDETNKLLEYKGGTNFDSLYLYLLFATRMNMSIDRTHFGIDGTELFELLSCEVAKNYWGDRAEAYVFGTARGFGDKKTLKFTDAVNQLCSFIREGRGFFSHSGEVPNAKDGNLDVVVWKHFMDGRHGKLIGFGQCKTGTNWRDKMFELIPSGFCGKWVHSAPVVEPVRLFFLTSRIRSSDWYESSKDAGIIFDRCRFLDFAPEMTDLKELWSKWTKGAMNSKGLGVS